MLRCAPALFLAGARLLLRFLWYRSLIRLRVDLLSELGELLIGFFFLLESLVQQRVLFRLSKFLGERANRSIGRNFVVLDPLSCTDNSRVHQGAFEIFLHYFRALLQQAFHTLTFLSFRIFV